jgi:hypothetical protein
LPDVFSQTKNPNLGKFWMALDWKMLIHFMAIWNILHTFEIVYDHLVHFVFLWYIFPVLVLVPNLAALSARSNCNKRFFSRQKRIRTEGENGVTVH